MLERIKRERERRCIRDRKIVGAWELGESYAAIGKIFELSPGNVKDRIERYYFE